MEPWASVRIAVIDLLVAGGVLAGGPRPAAAQATAARAEGADGVPAYRVRVRVDVAAGALYATAEIRHPRRTAFRLSRDLRVRRVLADGAPVRFSEAAATPDGLHTVTVHAPRPGVLLIEYGGRLIPESYPPLVRQVNGIVPGRVELAGYIGWYPHLEGSPDFTFDLTADLPAGYVAMTNGQPVGGARASAGRVRTEWQSPPVGDMVLLAAPGLSRTARTVGGTTVELYASALPADYVEAMGRDIGASVSLLTELIGSAPPTDVVRLAYSPRPGWGYVRTPLIVGSEQSALAMRAHRFGPARDLRYIAHEVAHYWWYQADTGSPEDWINEGLAEYSALLAVERLVGLEFRDTLLAEYRERSATSPSRTAIIETGNDSPDREVNRYTRPVVMLEAARERVGSARMTSMLRALHERFRQAPATTAAFLDVVATTLGPEARDSFAATLRRKDWGTAVRYLLAPRDSVFLGSWTGVLAQAGATNTVVLHLVARDSVLAAALDSPDQGVRGIPVPKVRIAGDTLLFSLGNVGVSYRATLSPDHGTLVGTWAQGGASVPLALRKTP